MKMPPAKVSTFPRNPQARQAHVEPLESRQLMTVNPVIDDGAVRVETSLGRMTFLLNQGFTETTVANFLAYVAARRYDNTIVHRISDLSSREPNPDGVVDILQAGGYDLAANYPHVETFKPIVNEFDEAKAAALAAGNGRVNVPGTVAMAKTSNPDSATSEWFINITDTSDALDRPDNSGGFTTFARVIGGGMRVAEAIAGLPTMDATHLNGAFSEFPILPNQVTPSPVVISSIRTRNVLPITIDGTHRFVTWTDASGVSSTITLNRGQADLTFVGGDNLKYTVRGNRVTVTGSDLSLDHVVTRGGDESSVLSVTSAGTGSATLPDITVSTGNLQAINAPTARLVGDITAASGKIVNIVLRSAEHSTITTKSGALNLDLGTANNVSIEVTGGSINSLRVDSWVAGARSSIRAGSINLIEVDGDFTTRLDTVRDVNRIVVNGNIGGAGASTWIVGRDLKELQVRRVASLTLTAARNINSFKATDLLVDPDTGTGVSIKAKKLGYLEARHVINATISGSNLVGTVNILGTLDSTSIRSDRRIDIVRVHGNLTGRTIVPSTFDPNVGVYKQSVIFAGVVGTFPAAPVTVRGSFVRADASIGGVVVRGQFSNTSIAAPTVGPLELGRIKRNNGKVDFGVTADIRLDGITATVGGNNNNTKIAVPRSSKPEHLEQYFANAGITQKDLGDFRVRIV